MDYLCSNCYLKDKIDNLKDDLISEIDNSSATLVKNRIVDLSQQLDELVFECIICKKRINTLYNKTIEDFFGTHPAFYYYGSYHLLINMFFYIKHAVENNEAVYISMEDHLYKTLMDALRENRIDTQGITFSPVKDLILLHKAGGLKNLRNHILKCQDNILNIGFKGIRWIGQPTYAIKSTSREDFLNWEQDLTEALKDTRVSLICVYDYYDCMNKSEYIDREVIIDSLKTHSLIYKQTMLSSVRVIYP